MKILAVQNRMGIGDTVIFLPFIKALYKKFNSISINSGITATCNGFYSFQGRKTRIPLKTLINFDDLTEDTLLPVTSAGWHLKIKL